jgi:hypothetical protein
VGPTPSTFPPEDINATHTHASYSKQPIAELANNDHSNWTLTLNVPIPEDIVHPTLASLSYTVKYSTANDQLASAVQTTLILTSEDSAIPDGIAVDQPNSAILFHYGAGTGFAPQNVDGAAALCLLSMPASKPCEQPGQWNHYLDRQQISPSIRITTKSCLKLRFHVAEYPTATMIRSLLVDVSATWLEDLPGKRLLEMLREAEKKAEEAERHAAAEALARQAAEAQAAAAEKERAAANKRSEEARIAREAAEVKAKEAESIAAAAVLATQAAEARAAAAEKASKVAEEARVAAEKRSEEVRIAKEAAEEKAKSQEKARLAAEADAAQQKVARDAAEANLKVEKQARAAAEHMLQVTAPPKADAKLQKSIAKALDKLPSDRRCTNGYVWNRTATGYKCDGGGHSITFEELAAHSHI